MCWRRWLGMGVLAAGLVIFALQGVDLSWRNQDLAGAAARPSHSVPPWVMLAGGLALTVVGTTLLLKRRSD